MPFGHPSQIPLNIALFGYGKMGKSVEKALIAQGHSVTAIAASSKDQISLDGSDLVIDFTKGEAVIENVEKAGKGGKNIVIGTTGWQKDMEQVKALVEKYGIGAIYSPNFSLGVLLFLKLVKEAAKIISPHVDYDAAGEEIHHSQKKDAPSGTAVILGDALRKNWPQLEFSSVRVGHFPGTHTLYFDSPFDTITLTHTAKTREGFARGAVFAAEWLYHKKGLFTVEDIL
jgi:4-hydroxy-tetrahydrodipicolinate reductase